VFGTSAPGLLHYRRYFIKVKAQPSNLTAGSPPFSAGPGLFGRPPPFIAIMFEPMFQFSRRKAGGSVTMRLGRPCFFVFCFFFFGDRAIFEKRTHLGHIQTTIFLVAFRRSEVISAGRWRFALSTQYAAWGGINR